MESVSKLSPQFCGPFKILQQVGPVAYRLELPPHSKLHPVFHVSRLCKRLIGQERPVDDSIWVHYVEPPVLPHKPERVLDYHMLRTRHHVRKQALIKWKDCPDKGSTWENISDAEAFPYFCFRGRKVFPKGGVTSGLRSYGSRP